jgi:isopentenyl-diphosphate Delta-isomerase
MIKADSSEERYDILDVNGNRTGEVFPKNVVHEKELLHGSVFIWIYNNKGEVLLQLRDKNKKSFPNVWDVSVAGHISAGDTPLATAVREIEEEIGIIVSSNELTQVEFVHDVVPWLPEKKHPELCWVLILQKEIDPNELTIEKSELSAIKLQHIDEIQLRRKKPNSQNIYAARNTKIYDTAFDEIMKRLA